MCNSGFFDCGIVVLAICLSVEDDVGRNLAQHQCRRAA